MSLAELSEQRVSAGLDAIVAEFAPGQSLPARLVAGRDAAAATLRQYVPNMRFDVAGADTQAREIDAWAERNEGALSQIMASSETQIPDVGQLRLQMGSDRAQAWVISSFTQAAAGLGPWTAGAVADMAARREVIDETWARSDAAQRLDMFALIIKMDRDGSLAPIFEPPASASGLGLLPVWAIVVIVVALAAALVVGLLLWRRIELNNRLMRDICERAMKENNQEVIAHCLDATRDLQVSGFERAAETFASKLGTAVIAAAAIYAVLRWGLPWAEKQLGHSGGASP